MKEKMPSENNGKKIVEFLKQKYAIISYILLAVIAFVALKIRTRNLSGLRDVTTGTWTLGPDLDPFLFLRWAKYIAENGQIMAVDSMRYVPFGFDTSREFLLHPYMISWFHRIASIFGSESITQSAAIYPAFFFVITIIAFFMFVRKVFIDELGGIKANAVALISSFFFSVIPILLPRTIAGVPEKESAAFFFLFLAFYFLVSAWKSKRKYGRYILALLAGLSTAAMASVWGGYIYIFTTLALATFISFILGQITRERFFIYTIWLFTTPVVLLPIGATFTLESLITSITTGIAFGVFGLLLIHQILQHKKIKSKVGKYYFKKLPSEVNSLIIFIILAVILVSVAFGPSFIFNRISEVFSGLIRPVSGRIGVTVAEARQPYFTEWAGNFGPRVLNVPIFFWMFVVGSVALFFNMIKSLSKRERWIISSAYAIFILSIIFSRYDSNSALNGENFISVGLYFLGVLILLGSAGFYYFKRYREGTLKDLNKIDSGFIFVFTFFFFSVVSARSAIRLILVLTPAASIMASYFVVYLFSLSGISKRKINVTNLVIFGAVAILMIYSGFIFYQLSNNAAQGFIPSTYNQQWQKAMGWVRENTAQPIVEDGFYSGPVFSHWWDYGYWVQSIGERATVLDGGNSLGYWNHLMGRYALTGTSSRDAAEFLYAHNVTHFLIDSTEIAKYAAFSSIGSDADYDRRSWINTFLKDPSQTTEKKDNIVTVFQGGSALDEDLIYNGTLLPGINDGELAPDSTAAIVGIILEKERNGVVVSQPTGAFFYNGQQHRFPLRYLYYNGELFDFNSGVDAGVFVYPRLDGSDIDMEGAALYLSGRTVRSQLARLYLYEEEDEYFKIAHTEEDFIIGQIKAQNPQFPSDFIYYNGFRGPIRIWELDYPSDIQFNSSYIETEYPEEIRRA